ncbi:MAG: hypothetical protein ACRED0_12205 [Gammaproteobacteria bacterium]
MMRCELTCSEARFAFVPMHRIGGAFISGAGLLVLLPLFLKDAIAALIGVFRPTPELIELLKLPSPVFAIPANPPDKTSDPHLLSFESSVGWLCLAATFIGILLIFYGFRDSGSHAWVIGVFGFCFTMAVVLRTKRKLNGLPFRWI